MGARPVTGVINDSRGAGKAARKPRTKPRTNKPAGPEVIKVPDSGGNIEQVRVLAYPINQRMTILDEVLIELNWSEESMQLASVEADMTFKNNGGFAKQVLKPGTWLRLQFFDPFRQEWKNLEPQLFIWERAQTDDVTREARVRAFDVCSFLHNQDTQDWFFRADRKHKVGWTASQIATAILFDLELPAVLAKTKFRIPWLYMQEHTPFEAIVKAYTRDRQITGTRWRIQAGPSRKVTVLPYTKQNKVWVIAAGSNLIGAEWNESLSGRKTEVIVLAINPVTNVTRGARATSAKVREFGRLREVIYLEKGSQAYQLKAFAREALKWVDRFEHTIRVSSEGLAPLRAGDAVFIEDPDGTGLNGRYFVTEITHNITAAMHTMDLTLSDIAIVPALFPTRDELARPRTTILGIKSVEGPLGTAWFPPFGSRNISILQKVNSGPHAEGNTWMMRSAVDIKAPQGSNVYACFSGEIKGIKTAGTSGHLAGIHIYLDNGGGPTAFYSNLMRLEGGIGNGSQVQVGDVIGISGNKAGFAGIHFALSKERFGITDISAGLDPQKFVDPPSSGQSPLGVPGSPSTAPGTQTSGPVGGAVDIALGSQSEQALAKKIDDLLRQYNSPMGNMGAAFVSYGKRYAIAAAFLVGIAYAESTFATGSANDSARAAYNPFGMLNSGPGSGHRQYGSYEEALQAVCRTLDPQRAGSSYVGRHYVDEVRDKYCGSQSFCPNWSPNVNTTMQRLGFDPAMRVR